MTLFANGDTKRVEIHIQQKIKHARKTGRRPSGWVPDTAIGAILRLELFGPFGC